MNAFWKRTLSASLIAITATVLIPGRSEDQDPTTLSEFGNYRLTDIGGTKLNELYDSLSSDLTVDSFGNCYERAHVWTYQLYKHHHIQSGKVFLFYSYRSDPKKPSSYNFNGKGWWFHVAPYVVADGKEYVLEKFGDITVPMLFEDWSKKQSGGNNCLVLSSERKWDRKNIFKPLSDPKRRSSFQNTLGPCFIRKAPMYYKSTGAIGAQGLGDANYRSFSTTDVFNSCFNTLAGDPQSKRQKCNQFIATGNPDVLTTQTAGSPATASSSYMPVTPELIQPENVGAVDSLFETDESLLAP